MEKIDRRIFKDSYMEGNRELINKCMDKLDEIIKELDKKEDKSECLI